MALTPNQKQRVKSMSAMLKNTKKLAEEMTSSNRGYAKDLEGVFYEVQKSLKVHQPKVSFSDDQTSALTAKNNRDFLNKRKVGQRPEKPKRKRSVGEEDKDPEPAVTTESPHRPIPKWAKVLYRSIALQTHPDKVQGRKDWSALKKEKYTQIGMKVSNAYANEEYSDLISLGCEIEIFSAILPIRQQMSLLNHDYSTQIKLVDDVQQSLAWRWGSFWMTAEERVKIIQSLCVNHGFQPPPVDKIESILKKLDLID